MFKSEELCWFLLVPLVVLLRCEDHHRTRLASHSRYTYWQFDSAPLEAPPDTHVYRHDWLLPDGDAQLGAYGEECWMGLPVRLLVRAREAET